MSNNYEDDREYAPDQGGVAGQVMTADVTYAGSVFSSPFGQNDASAPDELFQILENAVPRPDDPAVTVEDLQRRREAVEQTWDRIRRWLWAHESQEDRAAAAYIRGQADVTPLHLMCKLNNPPTDIISDIVEAAPEVVSWVDSHGWLPLHHACANGASPEVLQILTNAYPESKTTQDNQNRTPLHFYATRNTDNPVAMAANVELLSDTGAAELPDRGGMLPMHYACAYGTSPSVLKVLAFAYPESLTAKENKGRTPMHLAMVNAHRDASPGVLEFLLQGDGAKNVNMRDNEGNLPLHLLNLGLRGLNLDEPDKLNNVQNCLKLYLAAQPTASPDFLAALQDLPDWLQDVAVVSPHVRNILNKKIVQRFPTSILMLDGIMLLIIIVCFEVATSDYIEERYGGTTPSVAPSMTLMPSIENSTLTPSASPSLSPTTLDGEGDGVGFLIMLYIGASYFLIRELIQVIALCSLGALTSWFYDTTNWLDMAVITLVFYYSIIMSNPDPDPNAAWGLGQTEGSDEPGSAFRAGVAFTKGVLWLAVIYFLKSTQVDFAVFLGGVFYVVQRLVAFLLAVGVILLAFAQMFYIVYQQRPVCQEPNDNEDCRFPHCEFKYSLLKVSVD